MLRSVDHHFKVAPSNRDDRPVRPLFRLQRHKSAATCELRVQPFTIHVNNKAVKGQADLKDGDLLEIKGVKMYFYLKEPNQP